MKRIGLAVFGAALLLSWAAAAHSDILTQRDDNPQSTQLGQIVEPDIAYIPAGWHGYKYWMAVTPYPYGDEEQENPSIQASNDGVTWTTPTGMTNPTIAPGFGIYTQINNDPSIVFTGSKLIVYYVITFRTTSNVTLHTDIKRLESSDGIHWTDPSTVQPVYTLQGPGNILSPSVVLVNGKYLLYYLNTTVCGGTSTTFTRLQSDDGFTWTNPKNISLSPPSGLVPFHSTVKWVGDRFVCLYAAFPSGTGCGGTSLFYAESNDDSTWTSKSDPLLSARADGHWDCAQIYRSTFLVTGRSIRVWYSGRGNTSAHTGLCPNNLEYYMGYASGCLDQCFANAPTHDTVPTYDGQNQVVDPDLVYVPTAWHGYEYWMVMTPYTCGDETTENPSIVCGHDGRSWTVPTNNGTPINPIAPGYGTCDLMNGDPCILLVGDSLIVYYTVQHRNGLSTYQTDLKRLASNDGVHWTNASTAPIVYSKSGYFLSPSIVKVNSTYYLYWVDATTCTGLTQNPVRRLQSTDGFNWSTQQTTTITNAANVIFHLLVKWTGDHYAMVYAAYPTVYGSTCGNTSLYYASSTDGLAFTGKPEVILTANVGSWDDLNVYRAAFIPTATNGLRLWYAGRSSTTCTGGSWCSGNNPWYLGYTEGCLSGTDCIPPAAISLSGGGGCYDHIYLNWPTTGDDGTTGTAAAYDLRWSTSTITDANFGSATSIATPTPQPAGNWEEMTVSVPYCSGRRYYAIKARDEVNNWSPLSNVIFTQPACPHPPLQCFERAERAPTTEPDATPASVELSRPEPNPADRGGFHIRYGIPAEQRDAAFDLSVFDLVGRRVAVIDQGRATAGYHDFAWNLRTTSGDVAERGVYFVKLRLGSTTLTRRVIVLP